MHIETDPATFYFRDEGNKESTSISRTALANLSRNGSQLTPLGFSQAEELV